MGTIDLIDAITRMISTLGFPIVVAMFVLWRLNGKVDRLALAMERVAGHLDALLGPKDGDKRDDPHK